MDVIIGNGVEFELVNGSGVFDVLFFFLLVILFNVEFVKVLIEVVVKKNLRVFMVCLGFGLKG